MKKVSLVYFQHDLRIHDHPGLTAASQKGLPIIGVYLLNQLEWKKTKYGLTKMGAYRQQFLFESLAVLKQNLASLNIPLLVFTREPKVAANQITLAFEIDAIYAAIEPGREEQNLLKAFQLELGVKKIFFTHDKPLLSPANYPWLLSQLPGRFTDARMKIESSIHINPIYPTISPQLIIETLTDDFQAISSYPYQNKPFIKGGETAALLHLNHYFFEKKDVLTYKETRNNMLRFEDSSKLSPALSLGLISPRWIYWQLKKVEATIKNNQSTYWLWFELLWRDYFYYLHLQKGDRFFLLEGIMNVKKHWEDNPTTQRAILDAKTGYPLVDANLKELFQTGWMSNRGRQNVASFIAKILKFDWRFGAALFEHFLIDYDVSSNYGNWQYVSGVGVDPREERIFNVTLQAKKYDEKGEYIKHWLPELAGLPVPLVYQPWLINGLEMGMYQFEIGKDYPHPIVRDARVELKN
ncbi:MAG: hypothetical protein RIS53_710 [Bacillota bacterium]